MSVILELLLDTVTSPPMPEASISPNWLTSFAPPWTSLTMIRPLRFSTSTEPETSVSSTAPNVLRTTAFPVTFRPLTWPVVAVTLTPPRMSAKVTGPKLVVSSARPATAFGGERPVRAPRIEVPPTFLTSKPAEGVGDRGFALDVGETTRRPRLPLVTWQRFPTLATVMRPKRPRISRSPSTFVAVIGPLELTTVASPALSTISTEAEGVLQPLLAPPGAGKETLPLLLTTSPEAFKPSTSTSPKRLRTASAAASGIVDLVVHGEGNVAEESRSARWG